MKLETIQSDFIDAFFGNRNDNAVEHVIGDNTLTAEQRLKIYRGSVHGILSQALATTFPVCKALVGDKFFDAMCDLFIDQNPPTSPFFAEYGQQMPAFLGDFRPAQSIPYLADMALLEWTRNEIWHKTIQAPADFSGLAEINEADQAKVLFELNSSLRLLASNYRIDKIWYAHQPDSDLELGSINVDETVQLIVWKAPDNIKLSIMNDTDGKQLWEFLNAIGQKNTIERLAEIYSEAMPGLLNRCIQQGWVQSYKIT